MNRRSRFSFALIASASVVFVSTHTRRADACGACFHPPPPPNEVDSTVVTDHRMAFALSTTQSVLWDQIRYSGSPTDFAWVLPVLPGTQVQLSSDAWLAALDATTATVIRPPPLPFCGNQAGAGGGGAGGDGGYPGNDYAPDYGGSGGCGCFGASSAAGTSGFAGEYAADAGAYADSGSGPIQVMPPMPPPVTVTTQETVGPYEVVVLHSSKGEALDAWLTGNGYAIPPSIEPVLQSYIAMQMDFVAMKLAPGANVNAMQPVRVIEPGADPSLPLRMIAAGAGAHVGIALWVVSEGRYHPQNFPDVTIDFGQLAWDVGLSMSTYSTLEAAALASQGGRGWLTQFAGPATLTANGTGSLTPGLLDAYRQACVPTTPSNPCSSGVAAEAGTAVDAAPADAAGEAEPGDALDETSSDAASLPEAAATPDAAAPADAGCVPPTGTACDDPDVAFAGLDVGSIWITRLEANLPVGALGTDLVLEATGQSEVSNVHDALSWIDGDPCTQLQGQSFRYPFSAPGGATGGAPRAQSCALGSSASHEQASIGVLGCLVAAVLALTRRRTSGRSRRRTSRG